MIGWLARIFDSHARLRERLSAYLDGELEARDAERLEAHLSECESCRDELEGLRAISASLRELPEAEAPRSFALRPAQVEGRPATEQFLPPLAIATRIAASGVAVALAVIVVIDIGGFGDESDSLETAAPAMQSERAVDFDAGADALEDDARASPEEPGAAGDDAGGGATGESAPELDGSATDEGDVAEPPEAAPESTDDGGGIDALTVVEIGLGVALAALIVVTIGVTVVARRP